MDKKELENRLVAIIKDENSKLIYVPNENESYWDNFYRRAHAEYCKKKFIWKIKNINLN